MTTDLREIRRYKIHTAAIATGSYKGRSMANSGNNVFYETYTEALEHAKHYAKTKDMVIYEAITLVRPIQPLTEAIDITTALAVRKAE